MDPVKITVDGREIVTEKGKTVIQAAADAGIDIPHYCYHPKLTIAGNCRMCLVEIEKMPELDRHGKRQDRYPGGCRRGHRHSALLLSPEAHDRRQLPHVPGRDREDARARSSRKKARPLSRRLPTRASTFRITAITRSSRSPATAACAWSRSRRCRSSRSPATRSRPKAWR